MRFGRRQTHTSVPATRSEDDRFEFAADHPLSAFDQVYRALTERRIPPGRIAGVPDPLVLQFVLALRTVTIDEWEFLIEISNQRPANRLAGDQFQDWVRRLGRPMADDLSLVWNASVAAVLRTLLGWLLRMQDGAVAASDVLTFERWARVMTWLQSGGDRTINGPAGYFATRSHCIHETSWVESLLSEVLPFAAIVTTTTSGD